MSVRSLIEPIRKILARLRGHFVQGKAVDLVMSERLVEIEAVMADGSHSSIYLPWVMYLLLPKYMNANICFFSYDKLIIAVGSSSSTHGVPGLNNCFQLKTIGDAQAIRRRIMGTQEATS